MQTEKERLLCAASLFSLVFITFFFLPSSVRAAEPKTLTVRGQSMAPLLQEGQEIVVSSAQEIKRGDLVVFSTPAHQRAPVIKKVAGVGGDRLDIKEDGIVTINDKTVKAPDGANYVVSSKGRKMLGLYKGKIPDGRFFVVGAIGSLDSSRIGLLSQEDIAGVVRDVRK